MTAAADADAVPAGDVASVVVAAAVNVADADAILCSAAAALAIYETNCS